MRLRSIINRCKREEGSAAVEFALVAVPFIYMTIAIFELCVFFASANTLEYALSISSRMIRTGQLQASGSTDLEATFKSALCDHMYGLLDCSLIGLESVAIPDGDFTSAENYGAETNPDGTLKSRGFDPGVSGSVVLVRVFYRYHMMTPLFAKIFSTQPDDSIVLLSTVVLENEPYTFNPNGT